MSKDTLKTGLIIYLIIILLALQPCAKAQTTKGETKKPSTKTQGKSTSTVKNKPKGTTKKTNSKTITKTPLDNAIISEVYNADYAIRTLSKPDISLLIEDIPQTEMDTYAASKEKRREVLEYFRQIFLLAEEARATGIADNPKIKSNYELLIASTLADAYKEKLNKETGKDEPAKAIAKRDIEAYFKRDDVKEKFNGYIEGLKASGQLSDEETKTQLSYIREDWASVYIRAEKAMQMGLHKQRKVQLKIQHNLAAFLASEFNTSFQANEEEVAIWKFEHSEYDTKPKRDKADVLLKRARSGEDFAKLANDNTEDPGNKDSEGKLLGGIYEFGRGVTIEEFEETAFALKVGEISDIVESEYGFYIIKLEGKEVRKNSEGKEEEIVKVRSIFISTMVDDPESPSLKISLRERALREIHKQKRSRFADKLSQKYTITLPDDFDVKVTSRP